MKPPKKKLSGLKVKQQALYILIFSFVTVVIWISGSLFKSQKRTGIAPDLLELAKPLNPSINVDLIDNIEQSNNYSENDLANFEIYKLIKSKDGRLQRVVPIGSDLNEISEEDIQIIIKEKEKTSPLNQELIEEESLNNAVPNPVSSPRVINPPGYGEDGKFYLD